MTNMNYSDLISRLMTSPDPRSSLDPAKATKVTRGEVESLIRDSLLFLFDRNKELRDNVSKAFNNVNLNTQSMHSALSQMYALNRGLSVQVDALLHLLSEADPEFMPKFEARVTSLAEFVQILDRFGPNGDLFAKTMRERIAIARDLNGQGFLIKKLNGLHLGLPQYIIGAPDEFSPEEKQALMEEFDFVLAEEVIGIPIKPEAVPVAETEAPPPESLVVSGEDVVQATESFEEFRAKLQQNIKDADNPHPELNPEMEVASEG